MRKEFDAAQARHSAPIPTGAPNASSMRWLLRHADRPCVSGISESAHFLLETVGEDVIRALPRFFYKYRAMEKIAEGRLAEDALLLAERINGLTAFAHGLAFARALEAIRGVEIPARTASIHISLAELERLRHHTGAIAEICESTALAVASSQAAMLEEELLRVEAR